MPVVLLDTGRRGLKAGNVKVDYGMGIREAVEHLVGLGHKRIGYIGGPSKYASARARRRAFINSLKKYNLPKDEAFIQKGNFKIDGGEAAMENLLKLKKRPTAVLAANDLSAIGALHTTLGMGLKVPENISIIGFDDIDFCQITKPPLTTIRLSRRLLAEKVFNALASIINDKSQSGRQHKVETHLIIRSSTGGYRGT
jgi:LacI family transcriptional regulator